MKMILEKKKKEKERHNKVNSKKYVQDECTIYKEPDDSNLSGAAGSQNIETSSPAGVLLGFRVKAIVPVTAGYLMQNVEMQHLRYTFTFIKTFTSLSLFLFMCLFVFILIFVFIFVSLEKSSDEINFLFDRRLISSSFL